ncbi:RICIN domain-containing protein [Kribbella sindirgiensis]|uniref:Ricin B lectin domain-containing protein n=1 Tax=Kribbella sindirgiensis TaxID=1124744 RepID=A0A4R0IMP4_9ACTN|nr:RICIN domain-containing protein [Kribbella sindirgiensis]TCC34883.1 hypothetical protein E0H50_13400 [Kribbella sindirgiensis]
MFKKRLRRALIACGMVALTAGTAAATPAHADGFPVDSSFSTKWLVRSSGKALAVGSWWQSPGSVYQQTYEGLANQKFKYRYFADGHFSLVDTSWWGGCLDVENDSIAIGARIISKTCDGSPSQKWDYSSDPGNLAHVYLRNVLSGLYMTLESPSSPTVFIRFVQKPKTGTFAQQFTKSVA